MVKLKYDTNFDAIATLLEEAGNDAIRLTEAELEKIGVEIAAIAQNIVDMKIASTVHGGVHPIKVRSHMVSPREVEVVGSSGDSPIARLLEEGNKGDSLARKQFRHPLFGNTDRWYYQDKHPYLRPAWAAIRPRVHDTIVWKQANAIRERGFKVDVE